MKKLIGTIEPTKALTGRISKDKRGLSGLMGVGVTYIPVTGILQCPSILEFPDAGSPDVLYIDQQNNKLYRWDEKTLTYFIVGSDYEEISIIHGGNA